MRTLRGIFFIDWIVQLFETGHEYIMGLILCQVQRSLSLRVCLFSRDVGISMKVRTMKNS